MSELVECPECWICSGPVPTPQNPGIHNGSLSRFDNESMCCDRCGQIEAVGLLLTPLCQADKMAIGASLAEAQATMNRDQWRLAICTLTGSLQGYFFAADMALEKLLKDME